ncbi:hypothetical protein [Shimia sagamensis]|uniref:hypothetical protein n=1 Tax=Shimia sagamensis TaxID=1566352 RepID=UPI0024B67291|nr:hypothetical protein [Shimia sagamensis]
MQRDRVSVLSFRIGQQSNGLDHVCQSLMGALNDIRVSQSVLQSPHQCAIGRRQVRHHKGLLLVVLEGVEIGDQSHTLGLALFKSFHQEGRVTCTVFDLVQHAADLDIY